MSESIPSSPIVREPAPVEMNRALHLFRGVRLPTKARVLVAVRQRPVERFIAAMAWWTEGSSVCFKLTIQPGITAKAQVCGQLINYLYEGCRNFGATKLQYAELLSEDSDWIALLKENGFRQLRSERFFEIAVDLTCHRTLDLHGQFTNRIPPGWSTESIRRHHPEIIRDLIAPHRLMPFDEVVAYWRADAPQGFELDLSSILFDASRPIGVLLARKLGSRLCVDIRVVASDSRLVRSIGNIMLIYHMVRIHGPVGPISSVQFRGGEMEHRETANLALRMGGMELPPRHIFGREVGKNQPPI